MSDVDIAHALLERCKGRGGKWHLWLFNTGAHAFERDGSALADLMNRLDSCTWVGCYDSTARLCFIVEDLQFARSAKGK